MPFIIAYISISTVVSCHHHKFIYVPLLHKFFSMRQTRLMTGIGDETPEQLKCCELRAASIARICHIDISIQFNSSADFSLLLWIILQFLRFLEFDLIVCSFRIKIIHFGFRHFSNRLKNAVKILLYDDCSYSLNFDRHCEKNRRIDG